ncbi:MAG TPA: DUF4270 domain-containing protein, partial [Flavobacterium sp.]|nr:DUF4270 domain-containing protein [Flavobacterium sp.]
SIHGQAESKIKLSIYESTKYINTTDGNTQNQQEYYSDQLADFNSHITGARLNDSIAAAQNDEFIFDKAEQSETVTTNGVETTNKIAPQMKLTLDKEFFAAKLLSPAAAGKLVSNDIFKNYFRALHFKVEQHDSDQGQLAMLNFAAGKITVKYTQFKTKPTTAVPVPEREDETIVLKLTGNTVNLFELTENPDYLTAITSPNATLGDKKLYLKGGQGSMAVLELFKQPGELEALRATNKKWLINDASITFYIDDSDDGMNHTLGGGKKAVEPNRIYLYDLNNKTALLDYYTDSSISGNPKLSKSAYGGIIEKVSSDPEARGTKYKIRLTNHVRNLIANDTLTNVRLGLVVTEDINDIINLRQVNKNLKTPKTLPQSQGFDAFTINAIPQMSGINPLGTVLWGTSSAVAEDKKIKLIIHYTKPN